MNESWLGGLAGGFEGLSRGMMAIQAMRNAKQSRDDEQKRHDSASRLANIQAAIGAMQAGATVRPSEQDDSDPSMIPGQAPAPRQVQGVDDLDLSGIPELQALRFARQNQPPHDPMKEVVRDGKRVYMRESQVGGLEAPGPSEPTERIVGPNGKPKIVTRSQSIGEQGYEAPRQEASGSVITGTEGGPQFVNTRDGTARPVVSQATGAPVQMKPPANISTGYSENMNIIRQIDDAIAKLGAHPSATGFQRTAPDAVNQRLDPSGVPARAGVADVGSLRIHQRSGAAVSSKEEPRLQPHVPSVRDNAKANIQKLQRIKEFAEQENAGMAQMYPALMSLSGSGSKPSLAERVKQLKAEGLDKDAARAKLVAEGYEVP